MAGKIKKKAKKKPGRQRKYTKKDIVRVINKYADTSYGLENICGKDGNPCRSTVWKWIDADKDLSNMYSRAQELHMDFMMYETLPIADDGRNDYFTDSRGNTRVDHENINRSVARIKARQGLAEYIMKRREARLNNTKDKASEENRNTVVFLSANAPNRN
jgi:hypothetical protein